ncbi:hypothetical protein GGS21DRAFT_443303 [Xylaria nigripes]|nr:hypothetical protein GGS21DRAFT_443303 [Xylaria nigripes]
MALDGPLRSSTSHITSRFSSPPDMSISSPDSPVLQLLYRPMSSGPLDSGSSRSSTAAARLSPAPHQLVSPRDMVGPSPVTSIGTAVTEIEDEASDEPHAVNLVPHSQLSKQRTNLPDQVRQIVGEEAISVIHAPESFQTLAGSDTSSNRSGRSRRSSPRQSPKFDELATSSPRDRGSKVKSTGLPTSTPLPLSTDVKPVRYNNDNVTPRAQNAHEVWNESSKMRSSSASSLELILETKESETDVEPDLENYDDQDYPSSTRGEVLEDTEIRSLQTALQECWTLCNTLASLSTHHREKVFSTSGIPDGREKAWKCCWKLCQQLYNSRDEADECFNVRMNLDLCRDFCQALFDVRTRQDESSDSVLRVSFELNNHLYSAQDNRHIPDAFRERTLDFYITLCHRLMKQRGQLMEETNSLLRACWSLAEMLFSIRQNKRDGRAPDEELLGSAVQACWELCDIFREGWTQIRPDRGTPQPNQVNFSHNRDVDMDGRTSKQSSRSRRDNIKRNSIEKPRKAPPVPDTPVTEFEDTPMSPDSQSPQAPNILVLGTESNRGGRWSSSASNLSGYSQSSHRTSSTMTTTAGVDNVNIMRIRILVLKAAMAMGFSRENVYNGLGNAASLPTFVKSLPPGSFGSSPSHATLLQNYKNLVLSDSAFQQSSSLPARGRRVFAMDMAKSVSLMMMDQPSQYNFDFLRDLYKLVFGFHLEDSDSHPNSSISV